MPAIWTLLNGTHQNVTCYGPHEMCTGDVAAACWYSGIKNNSTQAQWLTDSFIIPTFSTGSPFVFGNYNVANSSCNPVWTSQEQPTEYIPGSHYYSIGSTGNDTAWSKVSDGKLEITIHYEVVDLGEDGFSPMSFRDANDTPCYATSERYILLLTYKFKNLHATQNVTGLEFYQMLHGHPGTPGDYSLPSAGAYEILAFPDMLENYTPCDSNHTVGNFCYDITLWNTTEDVPGHTDWMSISSTIAPDDFGFNYFDNYYYYQQMDLDIKNRNLNNLTEFASSQSFTDIAGAMKWNLGNLTPGQTKSITLALMYGTAPIEYCPWTLTKVDDVNDGKSVWPFDPILGNYLNYDICYNANGIGDTNVKLIDYLPDEVNYVSSVPAGIYDANTPRRVIWNISPFNGDTSGCVSLKVQVNNQAVPGGEIINRCELVGDSFSKETTESTPVDCYLGDHIYVDYAATGANNGSSWANAYTDLQTAIANIGTCANNIWIAGGTYKPTNDPQQTTATFTIPDGVNLFGHFAGTETSLDQRNFADANNITILTGDVNGDQTADLDKVVYCEDSNNIFDGLTLRKTNNALMDIADSNVYIVNCSFQNTYYGVYADEQSQLNFWNCSFSLTTAGGTAILSMYSDLIVNNCSFDGGGTACTAISASTGSFNLSNSSFTNYGGWGIVSSSVCDITVDRCSFSGNSDWNLKMDGDFNSATVTNCYFGNTTYNSITSTVPNLTISHCYIGASGRIGLKVQTYSGGSTTVKNCIIAENQYEGIQAINCSSPVTIMNCWIVDNGYEEWHQLPGIYINGATAAITIKSCTVANNYMYGAKQEGCSVTPQIKNSIVYGNGTGAFYGSFTQSYCYTNNPLFTDSANGDYHITSGSSCKNAGDPSYVPATGETDIDDGVRIRETTVDIGADEYCKADFSGDHLVNFSDFVTFSNSWLNTNDPNYSLDDDNDVDVRDLYYFCIDWLSGSMWLEGAGGMMMCMGGGDLITDYADYTDSVVSDFEFRASDLTYTTAAESFAAMPAELKDRLAEYYIVSPQPVAVVEYPKASLEEILSWLEEVRKDDEVQKTISNEEWDAFIKEIAENWINE